MHINDIVELINQNTVGRITPKLVLVNPEDWINVYWGINPIVRAFDNSINRPNFCVCGVPVIYEREICLGNIVIEEA